MPYTELPPKINHLEIFQRNIPAETQPSQKAQSEIKAARTARKSTIFYKPDLPKNIEAQSNLQTLKLNQKRDLSKLNLQITGPKYQDAQSKIFLQAGDGLKLEYNLNTGNIGAEGTLVTQVAIVGVAGEAIYSTIKGKEPMAIKLAGEEIRKMIRPIEETKVVATEPTSEINKSTGNSSPSSILNLKEQNMKIIPNKYIQ